MTFWASPRQRLDARNGDLRILQAYVAVRALMSVSVTFEASPRQRLEARVGDLRSRHFYAIVHASALRSTS